MENLDLTLNHDINSIYRFVLNTENQNILLHNIVNLIKIEYCRAAAVNRKKLRNSLWMDGGISELVDVSSGSYHWMYRSFGEQVAREPHCLVATFCKVLSVLP